MTETEIRNLLINRLAASAQGEKVAFISEMFVDQFSRRADLVMANGKLSVFEIKSERDSLDRLEGQISSYEKFFEEVTVVCAYKHQSSVKTSVPKKVGIWLIDSDGHLSVLRRAKPAQLPSIENWLSFLPVDELKKLLKEHGLCATGNRSVLVQSAAQLTKKIVRSYVLTFLKRRDERLVNLRYKKNQMHLIQKDTTRITPEDLHEYVESLSRSLSAMPRRIVT